MQLWAGTFSVTNDKTVYQDPASKADFLNKLLAANLDLYLKEGEKLPVGNLSLDVFDYQKAIKNNGISYIACRDFDVIPKFANDPAFSLVFINDEVAIFMVKRNFNQVGSPS
jgi:hypothetical protein